MKVLGLVASVRKLGNSEILVKEMLAALPDTVEKAMIRLPDLNIGQCQACYACLGADKSCIIGDDLQFLLDNIRTADAIIIGAPCYFLGTHTSLKVIGDRLISVLQNGDEFAGKKCIVVVTYGVAGWDGYAREATINFARFLHLDVVGSMAVQAANPGEAAKPEVLHKARLLAQRLMSGAEQTEEAAECSCRECGSSLLRLSPDGTVHCPMCGAFGRLHLEGGQFTVQFGQREHSRFSLAGIKEHGALLEEIKGRYIASRNELYALRQKYKQYDGWWIPPGKRR